MKKVIAFARVSTLEQDLENQKKEVLAAIRKDGFKKSEIVIVEGKESAIKLAEAQRQTLNELKEVLEENPTIKDVYFYAIDRLARKVSIVLSIVDAMSAKGVCLHFLNPYPMQTLGKDGKDDLRGKMFLTFLSIGAEMEMQMKNARFADARKAMKKEGKIMGGKALFGYYRDQNGFPQIAVWEAEAVKKAFALYNEGQSTLAVGKQLTIDGYFDGTKHHSHTALIKRVRCIIENPAYSGRTPKQYDSKEAKTIKYPAIVSVEEQDKAIARLRDKTKAKETENIYYAKGLVYADIEQKQMALCPIKGNTSYGTVIEKSGIDGGQQFNVNINVIDLIAWRTAKAALITWKLQEAQEAPFKINDHIKEAEKQKENVESIISNIQTKIDRFANVYGNGKMSEEAFNKVFAQLDKEKKSYEQEIARLDSEIRRDKDQRNRLMHRQETAIDGETLELYTDKEKAQACKDMLSKIIVHKTGKYEYIITPITAATANDMSHYYYNVSGGKKRLFQRFPLEKREVDISHEIVERFVNPRNKQK